jgi:hypothetical protein
LGEGTIRLFLVQLSCDAEVEQARAILAARIIDVLDQRG